MAQETILVVEDDENILELITFHLSQAGYTVQQTFTGEEALERASLGRPNLILLDLMLPKMNGLKVCAKLKGDMATRSIPIIIGIFNSFRIIFVYAKYGIRSCIFSQKPITTIKIFFDIITDFKFRYD